MAIVSHKDLTDPEIHEPKGIATADGGAILVSDGAGSGSWITMPRYSEVSETTLTCDYHQEWGAFTSGGLSYSGTDSARFGFNHQETAGGNYSIVYTGDNTGYAWLSCHVILSHDNGSTKAVWATIAKNGELTADSPQLAMNIASGSSVYADMVMLTSIAPGDVFEPYGYVPLVEGMEIYITRTHWMAMGMYWGYPT